jgi:hypothetical protein
MQGLEIVNTVSAVAVSVVAVGGILFHAGFTKKTLDYLKENSATKQDIELLRADVLGITAENIEKSDKAIRQDAVDRNLCKSVHGEVNRRLDRLENGG